MNGVLLEQRIPRRFFLIRIGFPDGDLPLYENRVFAERGEFLEGQGTGTGPELVEDSGGVDYLLFT